MKCSICGKPPVGQPQYIFDMAVFHDLLHHGGLTDDVEVDSQKCMRYRYKDAEGHRWESTEKPSTPAQLGSARRGPGAG